MATQWLLKHALQVKQDLSSVVLFPNWGYSHHIKRFRWILHCQSYNLLPMTIRLVKLLEPGICFHYPFISLRNISSCNNVSPHKLWTQEIEQLHVWILARQTVMICFINFVMKLQLDHLCAGFVWRIYIWVFITLWQQEACWPIELHYCSFKLWQPNDKTRQNGSKPDNSLRLNWT